MQIILTQNLMRMVKHFMLEVLKEVDSKFWGPLVRKGRIQMS